MATFRPRAIISKNLKEVHFEMLPNIKGQGLVALKIIEKSTFQDFSHIEALGIKCDLAINEGLDGV